MKSVKAATEPKNQHTTNLKNTKVLFSVDNHRDKMTKIFQRLINEWKESDTIKAIGLDCSPITENPNPST